MHISKTLSSIAVLALVLGLSAAPAAQAQEASANAEIDISSQRPASIRTNIETRVELNKDTRNNLLERKLEVRNEVKAEERASTTILFKRTAEMRGVIAVKMEARAFEIRKNALARQLTISLNNIENIAARIDSRIEKAEAEGRTMTDAKALIVIADEKLVKAKADVAAFIALTPVVSTTTATASTTAEADLTKPRALGDTAIKSVKEARDAYQKVVVAIAQSMGLKIRTTATTTVETTN
jgi:hypothetical protein